MRTFAACALIALALSFGWPRQGAAQAKTALSWVRGEGAEGCIGAPELGRRIEKLVGPVLAAAPEGEISIEGGIERAGAGYAATVAVSDASGRLLGRRSVRSDNSDCRTLDDQIAFVIAVAIDPNAALAELPGELADDTHPEAELLQDLQANPPRPAPLPERPRERPTPAASTPKAGALEIHAGGSVGAVTGLGQMPRASVGLSAALSLWTDRWSHHLRGTYWFPQEQAIAAGDAVAFALPELALVTCPELWSDAGFELAPCAGIALARLSVEPRGFDGTAHARWLLGPQLAARLARELAGPLSIVLWFGAESLWPRHRIDYELSGQAQSIRRIPVVMGRAELSLELRF